MIVHDRYWCNTCDKVVDLQYDISDSGQYEEMLNYFQSQLRDMGWTGQNRTWECEECKKST